MHSPQQKVIPARVNIKLDLPTNGEPDRRELPFKLLIVGDFKAHADPKTLKSRHRVSVTSNVSDAMQALAPSLKLTVANHLLAAKKDMQVQLAFNAIQDFEPESLIKQIPALRQMLAMRHLLKELRMKMADKPRLQQALTEICRQPEKRRALLEYLNRHSEETAC